MSSPELQPTPSRVLLAAGTATYESSRFAALDAVEASLQAVVGSLSGLGYTPLPKQPGYLLDPDLDHLRNAVRAAGRIADIVVVYYIGHGAQPEHDTYYLVLRGSQPRDLDESGLPTTALPRLLSIRADDGELAADQPQALVMLDCCYSGSAGMEVLAEALRGIGNPCTWVIASAGAVEYAQQGLFAKAFSDALRRPTTGMSTRFLSLDTIVQAVNDALAGAEQEARFFPPATGSPGIPQFFPNPSYNPNLAGLTVADQQHWLSRLRGAPEVSTTGFYLTGRSGRVRAAADLVRWMTDRDRHGLAVVTGSPGTGKSTLLALPVFLTQPAQRAALLSDAAADPLVRQTADLLPVETPLVAVHARGLNGDQVAVEIAAGLGRGAGSGSVLLEDLDGHPPEGSRILVVDAVDEAAFPATLLSSLLLPLARVRGLKVVLGARRRVLSGVGDIDLNIDLDSQAYQDPQALAHYIYRLLVAAEEPDVETPYQPHPGAQQNDRALRRVTTAVAKAIAGRATAQQSVLSQARAESFLIGRLLAFSVRSRSAVVEVGDTGWLDQLPASVGDTFDENLARLADKAPLARALLEALAWAHGPGLPWETIWVAVAQALAQRRAVRRQSGPLTDDDVRWLLAQVGSYVVEDLGAGGRSVYRPFHDLLTAHLKRQPSAEQAAADPSTYTTWEENRRRAETTITQALLDTVPTNEEGHRLWNQAHPYLRIYLPEHAHAAEPGTFSDLVADPDFLAVADPATLTPLLSITNPHDREVARTYRRARPLLGDDPRLNAAYLQEASLALTGRPVRANDTVINPIYRTHLASVRPDSSLLTISGHDSGVLAVAFGAGEGGRPLLASGSRDGTVRLWDPDTGAQLAPSLTGHTVPVFAVAFGSGAGGRPLLASGRRIQGQHGAVVGSGHRAPGRGAPDRSQRRGELGGVLGPDRWAPAASLRRQPLDGAVVGSGHRRPGRRAYNRPHPRPGQLGGVRVRRGRAAAASLRRGTP